jgi:hypothetical protein
MIQGKVLVTGTTDQASTMMAELYDPTTRTWSTTSNLNTIYSSGKATLLPDGKVLLTGGLEPPATLKFTEDMFLLPQIRGAGSLESNGSKIVTGLLPTGGH